MFGLIIFVILLFVNPIIAILWLLIELFIFLKSNNNRRD